MTLGRCPLSILCPRGTPPREESIIFVQNKEQVELPVPGLNRLRVERERDFLIDNLLVRIHFIIVVMRWPGFVPWEFGFPFPGSLVSTFLVP